MKITSNNGTSKDDKLFSYDDLLNISIGGLFGLAELTASTAFPAAITALVMQKILKVIDANLTDVFYEKQLNDYWKANREVTYRKILRQTELFGINSSLDKMDITSYIQQWIKENPMYAKQFPSMIETAISYSQQMLDDAKGSDVIDFYKRQVLSLIDWKEKYDRAYSTIPKSAIQPINFNAVDTKIKIPQKIDIEKSNAINKIKKPLNLVIDVAGMPSYVETGVDVATDFLLPEEKGHILTEEEIERLKKLQQFSILPSETSDVTSKIVSDFEEMNRNAFMFSDTLSNVAHIAGQLGGAFMKVDESIGKAIGSAGGLASDIYFSSTSFFE